MTFWLDEALAERSATVRAVEDGQVLVLEVWRTFDRLRTADRAVEDVDLLA